MTSMIPQKRQNDCDEDQVQKKKARDVMQSLGLEESTKVQQPTKITSSRISASSSKSYSASVDLRSEKSGSEGLLNKVHSNGSISLTIPTPSRMVKVTPEQVPPPKRNDVVSHSEGGTRLAIQEIDVTPEQAPHSDVLPSTDLDQRTEARDDRKATEVYPPKNWPSPFCYSLILGISFLCLFSNLITLGLWMQSNLALDVELRQWASTSGEPTELLSTTRPLDTLRQLIQQSADVKTSLASDLANAASKLEALTAERQELVDEMENIRQQSKEQLQALEARIFELENENWHLQEELQRSEETGDHWYRVSLRRFHAIVGLRKQIGAGHGQPSEIRQNNENIEKNNDGLADEWEQPSEIMEINQNIEEGQDGVEAEL